MMMISDCFFIDLIVSSMIFTPLLFSSNDFYGSREGSINFKFVV
jgi:hypothetical protein